MAKNKKLMDKRMVRIQAQAYYQAMKKYNAESETRKKKQKMKNQVGIRYCLDLMCSFGHGKLVKNLK